MSKPKVLVFIDWFLPGYRAGGPITSMRHMIGNLHQEIDFYVVTRNTDYQSAEPYDVVCNRWLDQETHHCYYIKDSDLSKAALKQVIDSMKFDMFYINGMYSKFFSIMPLDLLKKDSRPQIVAPRGMLAPSAMAIKAFKKKAFITLSRFKGTYGNVLFHATNEQEKTHVLNQFKRADVVIAPNLGPGLLDRAGFEKAKNELKLIFLGRIAPEKNTLLAIQSLKNVSVKVKLDIVGETYAQEYLEACKNAVQELPENVQVEFKKSISPDLVPATLQSYHYMFLPTKGENFGHAILESLMCGVPVLISDQTPWTHCKDEGVAFVSPNDAGLIAQTVDLLGAQTQEDYEAVCQRVSMFAQKYVKNSTGIEQTKAIFKLN